MSELSQLSPQPLWDIFAKICSIPHPSYHEEQLAEHIMGWAKEKGLHAERDQVGNILIRKGATAGMENRKPVALQAHLDMVPQKNNDTVHDFVKDPIQPYIDGEWVKARGTTLGADNGQAVACMMAFLARKDMKHPPLECVFTSQEEVGLIGAIGFDPYDLKGTRMINMDCGPEGVCVAGSAGGTTIDIYKTVKRVPFAGEAVSLKVRGLKGGHSGSDIDKERGNANKIAARVLYAIAKEMKVNLVSMDGGMVDKPMELRARTTLAKARAAGIIKTGGEGV